MSKNDTFVKARRVTGSREAVEEAIERSKDGRSASWERPANTGPAIPKWRHDEDSRPVEERSSN
jgi:hypothetical protein